MKVGFIGLGIMGSRMAANLLRRGHALVVHNRTRDKAEPLLREGAIWAESPAELAAAHEYRQSLDYKDFIRHMTIEPDLVEFLERVKERDPQAFDEILYVEQPFPYDLEQNQIDVHSVSARKPLFMDESAHDWHLVRLGRSLGWNGVLDELQRV